MKFVYEYRTRDNAVHSGEVCAATRDEAYAVLKRDGIRPARLEEATGVFNKLFGKGKRWMAIVALGILCVVLCAFALRYSREARSTRQEARFLEDTTRRQIIGDTAIIQKGLLDGWSDVFVDEGDRFLAGFAVPGVPVSVRNTSEEAIRAALARPIPVEVDDTLEARQIKAMVAGMKDELRAYLAAGGTIMGYGRCLVQRQDQEISYYNRAKAEIDRLKAAHADEAAIRVRWEALNDHLRKMGIKLVAFPE